MPSEQRRTEPGGYRSPGCQPRGHQTHGGQRPPGYPPVSTRPDLTAVSATQPLPIVRPPAGPEPQTPGEPDPERARWLRTLVGQALDDVEEGRMPVPDALRMVARLAWRDGHEHGR